jgi:hypothetical protein
MRTAAAAASAADADAAASPPLFCSVLCDLLLAIFFPVSAVLSGAEYFVVARQCLIWRLHRYRKRSLCMLFLWSSAPSDASVGSSVQATWKIRAWRSRFCLHIHALGPFKFSIEDTYQVISLWAFHMGFCHHLLMPFAFPVCCTSYCTNIGIRQFVLLPNAPISECHIMSSLYSDYKEWISFCMYCSLTGALKSYAISSCNFVVFGNFCSCTSRCINVSSGLYPESWYIFQVIVKR